jgi:hypothetical protein
MKQSQSVSKQNLQEINVSQYAYDDKKDKESKGDHEVIPIAEESSFPAKVEPMNKNVKACGSLLLFLVCMIVTYYVYNFLL